MRIRTSLATTILAVVLSQPIQACIWDRDTLAMERRRFPSTLELITGRFLRHSEEFYHWRIQDRLKRLELTPNQLAYYDDLAVAYDKVGKHERAIEIMLKKEAVKPGLYETYANLGTFYIHAGLYEKGLHYIDKAIEINPKAHFGREVYQRHLVEYMMSHLQGGKVMLPITNQPIYTMSGGFYAFLVAKKAKERPNDHRGYQSLSRVEVKAAVKGILGMMKFGNYRSPVLLEALGDLLRSGNSDEDAKRLAVRAYLKASFEVDDPETKNAYRVLAWKSLVSIPVVNIDERILKGYEEQLQREIDEANAWYTRIRMDESKWIAGQHNPEREFERKYYKEPYVNDRKASVRGKK